MKRILIFMIITSFNSYSQDFKIYENSISVVFDVDSVPKKEIHSRVLGAIANLYKSANNVIQLNDKENNKIIIKGINKIYVPNDINVLMPKTVYFPSILELSYNHTINIDIKDGRYRMIYETTSQPHYYHNGEQLFQYSINFKKKSEEEIEEIVKQKLIPIESNKLFYGKKKREAYKIAIPITYNSFYNNTLNEAKNTLISLNKLVQQKDKNNPINNDDW